MVVEPLDQRHVRDDFTCGNAELDRYLREIAGQDERRDVARCFVLLDDGSPEVLGYYTLSSYSVLLADLPDPISRRLPRYPAVPATLLGRLAVSVAHQGRKFGEQLLMDALERSLAAADEVASVAVVVDAIDDSARTFYQRYDFRPFEGQPMKLFLPMATIRKTFSD